MMNRSHTRAHVKRVASRLGTLPDLRLSLSFLFIAALASCKGEKSVPLPTACDESPGELYERRIRPLLSSDRPSTCNGCHAGGLNLSDFAKGTPCEAMACLKEAGLVNLSDPESSVLLSWIRRAEGATVAVSQDLVDEEHAGFLEWIRHEAECESCSGDVCPQAPTASCGSPLVGHGGQPGAEEAPPIPSWSETTDPGGCDPATLDALFRGTIYDNRGRCYPCHFVEEPEAARNAPRFFTEVGGCQVGSLASQLNILSGGWVDFDQPEASLLLLKPLAEADGGLPHGGDDKFTLEGDSGFSAFQHWILRYSACERVKP
jgi:hypothetical protein